MRQHTLIYHPLIRRAALALLASTLPMAVQAQISNARPAIEQILRVRPYNNTKPTLTSAYSAALAAANLLPSGFSGSFAGTSWTFLGPLGAHDSAPFAANDHGPGAVSGRINAIAYDY